MKVLCRQLPDSDGKHIRGGGRSQPTRGADGKVTAAIRCGRSGRSDLGGEPTCGPAHERMTAAPKCAPYCNRCTDFVERRPGPNEGKAAVLGEETGTRTSRAAGVGVQARREGCAEITSGRSSSQQGLTATCIDLVLRVPPRHEEGGGLAHESVRAMTAGSRLLTWSTRSRQVR